MPEDALPATIEDFVPPRRFSTASAVQKAFHHLKDQSDLRRRKDSLIQGLFDLNSPYSPSKLRQAGQGHRSNFNSGEAKGLLQNALVPYYDLFNAVPHKLEVTFEDDKFLSNEVSIEASRLLDDWEDFDLRIQAMLKDFILYNRGYVQWNDPWSWHFEHTHQDRCYIPDTTPMDLGKLEWFAVRQEMFVHEIYRYVRDEFPNWNKAEVLDSIKRASPVRDHTHDEWMEWQRMLASNELLASQISKKIQVAHVFVREFNDKWSHLIVDEASEKSQNFLYAAWDRYDDIRHFFCPFFFEILDGQWNAKGGLGHMVYAVINQKEKLKNINVDGAFRSSSLVLQARQGKALQEIPSTQVGETIVLNPNYDVVRASMVGDPSVANDVLRGLDSDLARNTGIYRAQPEQGSGNPRSASEVQLQFQNSTVLSNSAIQRFYAQLDRLYMEIYRRITMKDLSSLPSSPGIEQAQTFQKRLKKKGISLSRS